MCFITQAAGDYLALRDLDKCGCSLRDDLADLRSIARLLIRLDLRPARLSKVDVQREERVWLDGKVGIELVARKSVVEQPIRLCRAGGNLAEYLFAREGQLQCVG